MDEKRNGEGVGVKQMTLLIVITLQIRLTLQILFKQGKSLLSRIKQLLYIFHN